MKKPNLQSNLGQASYMKNLAISVDHLGLTLLLYLLINLFIVIFDRLCGLVVRVPGYRSRGPGSIPSATSFSEK
jgi:hypothetical protein